MAISLLNEVECLMKDSLSPVGRSKPAQKILASDTTRTSYPPPSQFELIS